MTPSQFVGLGLSLALGLGAVFCNPRPAAAAAQITLSYGPLAFPLPLSDLEAYVEQGQMTPTFRAIARHIDDASLNQLRQTLRRRYAMDEAAVYRMTQTPMVEDLLRRMGSIVNTPSGLNGFYAIRSALVLAAAEPGDWTVMDVLRQFPTNIRINVAEAQGLLNAARSPHAAQRTSNSNEALRLLY